MSDVPVPYLDDLRFQELVDEAKRFVPVRAPAWTDHNVSDPGITLIEACAARVDQLSYRTNQVPPAVQARILRLAGLVPTPPVSASTTLTFVRLRSQQGRGSKVTIPASTPVATSSSYPGPAVTFLTTQDLVIPAGAVTGAVPARNIVTVGEELGVSDGTPGQRFAPSGTPFLTANTDGTQFAVLTVTVTDPDGTGTAVAWRQVATFADVEESEPCFLWDVVAGQVVFGPFTPYASGPRHHGAVPLRGAVIQASYDTSQGSLANLPANTLVSWERSATIAVTNLQATAGGVDAESAPEAVARTNAVLVPLDRAVTADDYAQILTSRVSGIARVQTTPVASPSGPGGSDYVQVTTVPVPSGRPGEPLPATDQRLSPDVAAAAGQCAESARLLCARVKITDPAWVPFTVAATVYSWASSGSAAGQAAQQGAQAALFQYFHPTLGGPDGTGWPFGRPVHVGDAYEVLAGLPETITVVNVAIANQAGIPVSWIDVPMDGLPLLGQAQVDYVASGTDEVERVPSGMWGLFSDVDGTGKLLAIFSGNATGLENGVGANAKSVVNATSYTLEVFSLPASGSAPAAPADARLVVYPGTAANLTGRMRSAIFRQSVPDGTFCLYEHPAQAGKQWIFWPASGPIDLAAPSIGANLAVSSVLNQTHQTVELTGDAAASVPAQLFRPGETADLVPALNDKARFATLLDGPGEGQYGLTTNGTRGAEQWVFDRSVGNLPAVLGAGRTVVAAANQTPYPVALYPQAGFMIGSVGLQSVAPRSAANVLGPMAGAVTSAEIRPLGSVMVWGDPSASLTDVPVGLTDAFTAAAGPSHWLAVRADGAVTAWGANDYGQCSVPAGLTSVVAVAAGTSHSVALLAGGTVTAWGDNSNGQLTVPAGLTNVVAIAAGGGHSLALLADGTVAAWGDQTGAGGALAVPAGLSGVVAIATSTGHSLAVQADGTVAAWGANDYAQCSVPAGLGGVIAVAAGMGYSLALAADGTVTAWGYQTGDGGLNQVPAGLSAVVALAASAAVTTPATSATPAMRSLALAADGSIVTWGTGTGSGQPFASPPVTASRTIAVAAGEAYSLAICVMK